MRLRAPGLSAAEVYHLCGPGLGLGPNSNSPDPLPVDPSLHLNSIDAPDLAGLGSLTFIGSRTPLHIRSTVMAGLVIVEPGVAQLTPGVACLKVPSIHVAMAAILKSLGGRFERSVPYGYGFDNDVAPSAVVEGILEGNVSVAAGVFVGKGSYIGSGTRLEPNVVIYPNCLIGKNCVVQAGAVIGSDGFGFFSAQNQKQTLAPMPHPAGVEIGDDCWIGANSVVAAGVLNPTVLGRGCKLDSHVQIAHNVRLGEDCLLASQAGIAGSSVVGKMLRMGGSSSVDGHLHIGNDVSIAACSGVTKDFPDKSIVAGFPARPIKEWRRQVIALKRVARDIE